MTGASPPSVVRLYVLIVVMVLLWSLNFIIGKVALREFPPLLAGGLRASLAAVLILPVYFWEGFRGRAHRWSRIDVPVLLFLGLAGVALNQLFFLLGLSRTTVAHAAIVIGLTPVLVLLMGAATGQERITPLKLGGMLLALAGVALLQTAPARAQGPTLIGDLFIFLAAITFATFTVVGKRSAARHGTITVSTFAYVGGSLILAPITIWQGSGFPFAQVTPAAWLSLLYMALFPSVVCYLIFYYALTHISASRVSSFGYLQPLLATLLAIPLLGELPGVSLLLGGALVLTGVFLTERG